MVSKGKTKKLGFQRFLNSFRYSFAGLKHAYKNEQSLLVHFIISITVIIMGFIFKINEIEWILVFLMIALVMAAELLNTAIENIVDLVTSEFHPLAKVAKDTASAAVLIYSLIALITGLIVFVPHLLKLL
jgi:undecaprenol kinase